MFQGFYNLASSVLTQTRNLNVISNNMANVATPGYKSDEAIIKTFHEEMVYRNGNTNKSNPVQIGERALMVGVDRNYTDYTQGTIQPTTSPLDMALMEAGFFVINTDDGTGYTRNGSFSLDEEGYLSLQGMGRVQGTNGDIFLGTDQINVSSNGTIFHAETGAVMGQISVVDFNDYDEDLVKSNGDVYIATGEPEVVERTMMQKALEGSNANPIKEMTAMMASQRTMQSSAQLLSMYDQLTAKIVSQLGPR